MKIQVQTQTCLNTKMSTFTVVKNMKFAKDWKLFFWASSLFGLYHHDHSGPDGFVSAGVEPRNLPIKLFQKILRDVDQNPLYVLSHLLHPSFIANRRDEHW